MILNTRPNMMRHIRHGVLVAVFGGLLATGIPISAHHSISSEFDSTKEWTQKGVLTKIAWTNPHTATFFDVKNEQTGETEKWACEGNPPITYHRGGLNKADWRIGEEATITCAAAKDGAKHWGFLKMIKYKSDGRIMVFRIGGE